MSLYKKLLAVQQGVGAVKKNGKNTFHKYTYATEADILAAKDVMNEHGLVVLPTMSRQETGFTPSGKSWASVTLSFRVVDAETGECVESEFTGYAEDTNDKAIYKATTGANKYFYLKFTGMATDDDPENEKQAPKKEEKPQVPPVQKVHEVTPFAKNRALQAANSILKIQKRYNIANNEVLRVGAIDSIKGLTEAGDYTALEAACQRLKTRYPEAV